MKFLKIIMIFINILVLHTCSKSLSGIEKEITGDITTYTKIELSYKHQFDQMSIVTNSLIRTDYNSDLLPVTITRYGEDEVFKSKVSYKYDLMGNIIFELERNQFDRISGITEYDYNLKGLVTLIRNYDGYDQLLHATVYQYDRKGNVIFSIVSNIDSGTGMYCSNSYGMGNQLTLSFCYNFQKELLYGEINDYIFGKIKKEYMLDESGETNRTSIYNYDILMRLKELVNLEENKLTGFTRYQYDRGLVNYEASYDGETNLLIATSYSYDRSKNLTNQSIYYEPDIVSLSESFSYDEQGSLINYTIRGKNGSLISHEEYEYDNQWNVSEKREYDENEKLELKTFYYYDNMNNLIEETKYEIEVSDDTNIIRPISSTFYNIEYL